MVARRKWEKELLKLWIVLPRRRMCFVQFCTQLFLNYMLWLRSFEHLSLCEKGRRCSLFCIVVCLPSDMYMNANMWSILLGLPIESQRITSSWPDCEPVWCSLVLKFRPYYLMAMSKIRSNLTTSVYEK